ncbi:CheY-like superfamily, partial [Syncephalis pseudoplumigaleata]
SSGSSERASGLPTTTVSKSGMIVPPIKVLIVEDNPINQTILSTFLRKRKIEYAVASDGREAVEKWKNGGFHLVLMDIQLPVLDGIEATKEIRRFEKERKAAALPPPGTSGGEVSAEQRRLATQLHTPVIIVALTASALQADRNTALAAGCNDFLTKPVSLPWLEKKITEWGCMQALINVNGWSRWR